MKYLNLTNEEIRNIRMLTRKKTAVSYVTTTIVLLLISFCLVFLLQSFHFFNKGVMLSSFSLILMAALPGIMAIVYYFIQTYTFKQEIHDNKKRVYIGSVGDKRKKIETKNTKFYLYMDGMKFKVTEEDYNAFEIGDSVEFHVSLNNRYLLKVIKPSTLEAA